MSKAKAKQIVPFLVLMLIVMLSLFIQPSAAYEDVEGKYNAADITWVLISAALVFLMTPGLAFFYGGMVNRKNVLSTMMKSVVAIGVVSVLWIVVGYSLAFGEDVGGGFIGNPMTHLFFKDVIGGKPVGTIPNSLFAVFQLMFAIITPGLVVGAVAERISFRSYILFIVLFHLFIYCPLAHWTWHSEGFLYKMGVLDFAGGTVVHISAGCAALAGALVLKARKVKVLQKEVPPANIPYVLIGTGLLWFGWFGFNGGSALAANDLAVSAFWVTNIAAASAGLAWMFFDVFQGKKPSVVGFCIGAVVGLVAITPAAGFVAIPQSIFIGAISAIISNVAVAWKHKSKLDDTLDVFPCHGLGGIVGMLLTGVFATTAVNGDLAPEDQGLLYGGALFAKQLLGMLISVVFSFVAAFVIFKIVNVVVSLRVSADEEELGLDATQHNEKYVQGTLVLEGQNGLVVEEKEII